MSFPDDRLNSDPSLVQEMQEQAIAHASLHGASMMVDLERKQFLHIPTTLIPSQVRRPSSAFSFFFASLARVQPPYASILLTAPAPVLWTAVCENL